MNIVAVVSQKGGTGKSTICTNLAVAAQRQGLRTLVSDTDPQASALDWKKTRSLDEPMVLGAKSAAIHPLRFAADRAGVDLMIIDTQAASVSCAVEAAKIADLTLIVARPTPIDLRAAAATVAALKPLRRSCAFVLNQAPCLRAGREPTLLGEAVALLVGFGLPVAPTALRSRAVFQHAYGEGLSALECAPQSQAADEVARLWSYVAARLSERAQPRPQAWKRAPASPAFAPRQADQRQLTPAG
jgi:chromosome partitioning protein